MQNAVEQVIATMWDRYGEPLSLSEMARTAMLSPFHFVRVFRQATGVPPGRFLAAIRIHEAKRLLLTTSASVTDISIAVGYNSLGTFTRRFTLSVGISPSAYRRLPENGHPSLPYLNAYPDGSSTGYGSILAAVDMPCTDTSAQVYVGVFDSTITQGKPVTCGIARERACMLDSVPEGVWYVHAIAVQAPDGLPGNWTQSPLSAGISGPLDVRDGAFIEADVTLRPRQMTDMPILLALPALDPQRGVGVLAGFAVAAPSMTAS